MSKKKQKPTASEVPQHEDPPTADVVAQVVEPIGPSEASTARKPTSDVDAAASKGKHPINTEPSAQVDNTPYLEIHMSLPKRIVSPISDNQTTL